MIYCRIVIRSVGDIVLSTSKSRWILNSTSTSRTLAGCLSVLTIRTTPYFVRKPPNAVPHFGAPG